MSVRPTIAEKVWQRIDRADDGCWLWTGQLATGNYPYFFFRVDGKNLARRAHRFVYELLVEPIPVGLTLDHLCHSNDLTCPGGEECRHRRCVNPAHLEPVTMGENARRRTARLTHCPHGHPYSPDNSMTGHITRARCRICYLQRHRESEARRKVAIKRRAEQS